MTTINSILTEIARHHLDIPTLETRKGDSLDFHTVTVMGVRDALKAAYQAGLRVSNAAPELLAALVEMVDYWRDTPVASKTDTKAYALLQKARIAIAKATTARSPSAETVAERPVVTVTVIAGLIQDVLATMPVHVVVEEWDVPDEDTGKKPARNVWKLDGELNGPAVEKLRRLIANN